jgi:hypothetical protein
MGRILSKLAPAATMLLLAAVALMGVAWLRQAVPDPALPDLPFAQPPKPGPIEMASIPWKRNPAHPAVVPQPIAVGGLAWLASADRPGEVNVTATAVPWTSVERMPVNLTAAAVPWSAPMPAAGQVGAVVIQPAVLPWPIDKK